ncbi:MAG: hypothetical protein IPQ09_19980 [Myxococcales bacterium]|nr:hypothetical protein [Myxococcales bacterium]HQY65340.1 hypothetical protein [Polyangiaceae bacterium]
MAIRSSFVVGLALGSLGLAAVGGCTPRPASMPPPLAATSPGPSSKAPAPTRPCFVVQGGGALREADAKKVLAALVKNVRLSPADEALRSPKSLEDVRAIVRRDLVYFYPEAAAFARSLRTLEGKLAEAQVSLLLGDAMLVASQALTSQEAQVGAHVRIARANLAGEGATPSTDRGRTLAGLVRAVEEGSTLADALGVVAPEYVARGAELVRELMREAPNHPRTALLRAEVHRMRGEWAEVDVALASADVPERAPALCYLKAMEPLERRRDARASALALRGCLKTYPKLTRAQAALVMMAQGPERGAREIARLRKMDEDHYLVLLLEPTLAADRELVRIMTSAEAPREP